MRALFFAAGAALLAAPVHAQSAPERAPLRPSVSVAYGIGDPQLPREVREVNGSAGTLSVAAEVPIGRLARIGARFEQFAYTEPHIFTYPVSSPFFTYIAPYTATTSARARTVTAFLETASAPAGGARLFFWVGPTVVRYTGDTIFARPPEGDAVEVAYPERWGAGASAGLSARYAVTRNVSLLSEATANVLFGIGGDVSETEGLFSVPALRFGLSLQP